MFASTSITTPNKFNCEDEIIVFFVFFLVLSLTYTRGNSINLAILMNTKNFQKAIFSFQFIPKNRLFSVFTFILGFLKIPFCHLLEIFLKKQKIY